METTDTKATAKEAKIKVNPNIAIDLPPNFD